MRDGKGAGVNGILMLCRDCLMLLRILLAFLWTLPLVLCIALFNPRKSKQLGIIFRDFIRELRLL